MSGAHMFSLKPFKSLSFHLSLAIAGALSACGGSAEVQDSASTAPAESSIKVERSAKAATGNYEQTAQSLYVAYFGRPADQTGLVNLEQQLAAANAPTAITSLDT